MLNIKWMHLDLSYLTGNPLLTNYREKKRNPGKEFDPHPPRVSLYYSSSGILSYVLLHIPFCI